MQKECRICLSDDDESDLISPCSCKGTSLYVHYGCLQEWRWCGSVNKSSCYNRCGSCGAPYHDDIIRIYPYVSNVTSILIFPVVISIFSYATILYMLFTADIPDRWLLGLSQFVTTVPVLLNLAIIWHRRSMRFYLKKNRSAKYLALMYLVIISFYMYSGELRISVWASRICAEWFWVGHIRSMVWCLV